MGTLKLKQFFASCTVGDSYVIKVTYVELTKYKTPIRFICDDNPFSLLSLIVVFDYFYIVLVSGILENPTNYGFLPVLWQVSDIFLCIYNIKI